MKKEKLKAKEILYCKFFSIFREPYLSAETAGYTNPKRAACKLMVRKDIERYIEKLAVPSPTLEEVATGLRRIAFGSNADAIGLSLAQNVSDIDLKSLDLNCISEIKVQKGSVTEIKFFDRVKALEKLATICSDDDGDDAQAFFKALQNSAKDFEGESE